MTGATIFDLAANGWADSLLTPLANAYAQQIQYAYTTSSGLSAATVSVNYNVGLGYSYQTVNVSYADAIYQVNQWIGGSMAAWSHGFQMVESEEEKAARRIRELAAEAARKVAESKAESLLFAFLSDQQILQYQQLGYFETEIQDKIYRIKKGRAGNVELLDKGVPVSRYCAHPASMTPNQDVMLAQLLMLRTDEARFLRTANHTRLVTPGAQNV